MNDQRCVSCGDTFTPNAPRQVKCNACRFARDGSKRRMSGVPNPVQWRGIPGYEGRYEINTLGTIRSLDRRQTFLKPFERRGTLYVSVFSDSGYTHVSVGRLLLLAFDPVENARLFVARPRESGFDLRLENWYWHKARSGFARLTETDVKSIRALAYGGMVYHSIADQYKVSQSAIERIMGGHNWRHVR